MARYRCPCCGQPFNGRKCRKCFYETFNEEIGHGSHVHKGEPLVIDAPTRRPIPRKDPFGCDPRTRKKPKKKKNLALILALLYVFAVPALELAGEVIDNLGSFFVTSEVSYPEPQNQSAPDIPEEVVGTTLYEDGDIRIVTPWQGEDLTTELPIWLFNDSHRDLSLMLQDVVVNGFVMEFSYLSCDAPAGSAAMATLRLEEGELGLAGIQEIGNLSLGFCVYDTYSYETLVETARVTLVANPDVAVNAYFGGQVVYDADALRITCVGYQVSGVAEMLLLLENEGQQPLDVMITEMDLDGKPLEPFFWCRLPEKTRAIRAVMLRDEIGDPVEELLPGQALTFGFQITNDQETIFTDPITVNP